jgi:hypothetical protein
MPGPKVSWRSKTYRIGAILATSLCQEPYYTHQSPARIPRHLGNVLQPQNGCPAFAPCLATRFTIAAPQRGQLGSLADAVEDAPIAAVALAGVLSVGEHVLLEARALSIIAANAEPSMSSMLRP